jgi:riboflavin synthase
MNFFMFTGIVEETGTVAEVISKKNLSVLKVRVEKVLRGTKAGASIAVDGVCLTVTDLSGEVLSFDIMRETMLKTTLTGLKPGCLVNLERALKVGRRVDGHFVTGHVDGVGIIQEKVEQPNYARLRVDGGKDLMKYIVPKGSVCLDGVSLTVGEVKKTGFTVYLIPLTEKVTTLGSKGAGDKVNIETDILAKYVFNRGETRLKKEVRPWN